ncbi:histone deacetylase family protein [Paracoccus sp. P2]|uniref:histone deacetylase family protein n=1 Tax=Paracoccus TaxID=265 RepID=UPI000464F16B|nr:histone deacetylase family protein [Paracoccus pantotrophus]MDF3854837.1 histone deacetylase family protein [Paracoccus pantotrophus]RDD96643.1 histone deacetylase family protein [Paracoccus pantotrophus]RNI19578.1 histone deacetylase family protein [Paracoccus pantotrophus]WGR64025.1 histone deacetylase family protein [Paracoccus pantotrophus]SFO52468.1 Acetoin utilization deacetylase AcuC [Paracoccus pantotrophus]
MTLLYTHPSGFSHVTPPSHPEQVARLDAVLAALEGMDLERREAPEAAERDILRAHPAGYLALLRRKLPAEGWSMLDSDTYLAPGSLEAARHAAGGVCAAVDAVLAGEAPNAFVAMRPPGHHAERMKAMGFCILSSVAIAALRALDHHGLDRVAVLDFDVHHGNGTQDVLWDEKRAFFASTHQVPLYPGTGAASERGAHGQIVNMPLAPGSGGDEARAAWRAICDRVAAWRPQLVLVSAGFDAHADDPLAALMWREADFTAITRMICDTAAGCSAPVVSALEGGYDLAALGRSARAHVDVLRETAA